MRKNKHIGSNFNDFLEEEALSEEVEALAVKKAIAYELEQSMKRNKVSKTQMAKLMQTSRAQLDRLLDPNNQSVTLLTLSKAALATGKKLHISLNAAKDYTRTQFVKAIKQNTDGLGNKYHVALINGIETPRSNSNSESSDNLG